MTLKMALTAIVAIAALTSCSKNTPEQVNTPEKTSLYARFFATPEATLSVVDMDGKPIANAQILIGSAVGQPFANNYLTADGSGVFVAPADWKDNQMVTIVAPHYVTATYMAQTPHGQSFQLHASADAAVYEVKGQGTGFNVVDGDGLIDFAVMAPLLTRQALLSFDLSMFVSPKMDTISVYGQDMQIPSNISLPHQKEYYGFFPVTLEKPDFRLYFSSLGSHKVMTVRGQFPFKKVVKELQDKKQFVDLINDFSLQGGSIRDVNVTGATQNQDLPVNELVFSQTMTMHSPTVDSNNVFLAVALSRYQGQYLLTDVKNVASNSDQQMTTASGVAPELLTVLESRTDNQQMTSALSTFSSRVTPDMLPMMDRPQVVSANDVKIQQIVAPTSIAPAATYAVLSTLKGQSAEGVTMASKNWEVYSPNWETEIKLPQLPNMEATSSNASQRWEVSLIGSTGAKNVDLGPRMLETATHATHSATDF